MDLHVEMESIGDKMLDILNWSIAISNITFYTALDNNDENRFWLVYIFCMHFSCSDWRTKSIGFQEV